jgi:LPS O-antigen subunit length determinant protein (WzzB/FepE family)
MGMTIALWIIAICEVIRTIQNAMQLLHIKKSEKRSDSAYSEFIKSLHKTDREFVRDMLKSYEAMENEED